MKGRISLQAMLERRKNNPSHQRLRDEDHRDTQIILSKPAELMANVKSNSQNEQQFIHYFISMTNITNALSKCPDCSSLIVNCMNKFPNAFDHIVKRLSDLTELAKSFKSEADATALMQFILSHPDEFKRLVHTDKDVAELKKHFSKFANFFADKNPQQITRELKINIAEVHIAIMMLYKYNRDATKGQLKQIPAGIIIDIARHLLNDVFMPDVANSIINSGVDKARAKK